MNEKKYLILVILIFSLFLTNCKTVNSNRDKIINSVKEFEIEKANSFLSENPITVTASHCGRSAGGIHDFYSEGDYWWPDTQDPGGPYIQKDGQSNPDNFSDHRHAMVHFSDVVSTLTSAWLLSGEKKYAKKALLHLNAWFVDTATLMNPNMLYAQAISGRFTGRGIGLIDAYHLVEVAQSVKVLSEKGGITKQQSIQLKRWFSKFLEWMTIHKYGIKEMNAENNHATCWVATASSMAVLTGNQRMIKFCSDRFKQVLLPNQMADNGSFSRELKRTKPYGYSLFNIDAFCNVVQILSTPENNLWEFELPDGRSLKKGMQFIFPFIDEKSKWPYAHDIYIWDQWPVRQSSLLFAGLAYNKSQYIDTYLKLNMDPTHPEVIRNLPVRHPVIWIME